MAATRELFVKLSGKVASFTASMDEAAKKLDKTGAKMQRLGKTLASGIALPFASIGALAMRATGEVDDALDSLRASVGKTIYENGKLEESFARVFTSVPASAQDVSSALSKLSKGLKLSGKPLEDLATQVLNLSKVTGQGLGESINGTITLFKRFGTAASEQGGVLDYLFKVSQQSGVSFGELSNSLAQNATALKAFGYSAQQGADLLGNLSSKGFASDQVLRGLSIAVKSLAKDGVTDLGGALSGIIAKIKGAKTESEATAIALKTFGKSGVQLASAIRAGAFDVEDFSKKIANTKDTINSTAYDTAGFAERLTLIRNSLVMATAPLEGAFTQLLQTFKPQIEALVSAVQSLSKAFAELSPNVQATIVGVGLLLSSAAPLGYVLGGLVSSVAKLSGAFGLLKVAIASSLMPWAAIAAAIGVVYKLIQTDDFARGCQRINAALDAWRDQMIAGLDVIKLGWKTFIEDFGRGVERIKTSFGKAKDAIVKYSQEIYEGVKTYLLDKFTAVVDKVQAKVQAVSDYFKQLYDDVVGHSYVPDMVEEIISQISLLDNGMVQECRRMTDATAYTFKKMSTKVSDSMNDIGSTGGTSGNGIGQVFKELGEGVKDTDSDIGGFLDSLGEIANKSEDFKELSESIGLSVEEIQGYGEALSTVMQDVQKIGDSAQGTIEGVSTSAGAAIGAYLGGPEGAKMGAKLGDMFGNIVGGLFADKDHPDHTARQRVEHYLNALMAGVNVQITGPDGKPLTLSSLVFGDESAFDDAGWADKFAELTGDAQGMFSGVGEALNTLVGNTEDVGGQIAAVLANNLLGSGDNLRLFVQQLGLDFGQLESALTKAALDGKISWAEFETQLHGVADAFGKGRVAVADLTGAVDALIESSGSGRQAVKSLRDLAVEAIEAGANSLDGLRAHLAQTGKYTAAQIEAIFIALQHRGISSLDALANASDKLSGSVIADLEQLGFFFQKLEDGTVAVINNMEELRQRAAGLPAVTAADTAGAAVSTPRYSSGGSYSAPQSAEDKLSDKIKAEIDARKKLEKTIEDMTGKTFKTGDSEKFNQKAFDKFLGEAKKFYSKLTAESKDAYDGIASGLAQTLGVGADMAKQFAQILSKNVGGSLNEIRHLVGALNYSFEDMETAIVNSARAGQISWSEAEKQLKGLNEAFTPGVAGQGDVVGAFSNLSTSGGKGFGAIQSIRDLGIEAMEKGAKTMEELKAALVTSGKVNAAQAEKLFTALNGRGVTSLEGMAELSDRIAGGIIADLAAAGFKFNGKKMARGGVVTGPTSIGGGLGLIGEAGAEAILPLTKIGGKLGVATDGAASVAPVSNSAVTYQIDARGAGPGVKDEIMRALKAVEENAVSRALSQVYELKKRGGGFARAFG